MKSKKLMAVMLSGFMVFTSMTPVFAEEIKNENTNDNAVVNEEQQGIDLNSSEEVKDNEEAVITDKDNQDKTAEGVKAEDENKVEESTSLNESSKTVKSSSKTAKGFVSGLIDERTKFQFKYDEDTKEATITYIGNFSTTETDFTFPREVSVAGSEESYKVVEIAGGAFVFSSPFNSIKHLTVPKDYRILGGDSIGSFKNVETVTFETGSNLKEIQGSCFDNAISLKSITIPKTVESIGANAFSGCSNLEMIDTEEGSVMTSINSVAIKNCDNLKSIRITSPNVTYKGGPLGIKEDGTKINGFTIICHKGSNASKSALYQYYENNNDGSWVFKTDGICHGPNEVEGTRVDATCLNTGHVTYYPGTCECGNEVNEQVSVVLPVSRTHTYIDKIDKEATCTKKGSKHKECSVCGIKEDGSDADIDMLPHTFDKEVVDKAATCAEEGSKHVECSVCNTKKENSDETIGVIPHTFDKEVVDKEATYTEEGSKHTECSVCGTKKEGSDVVIPKIVKEEDNNNNGNSSSDNNSSNNGDSTSNGSTVTNTGSDKTAVNTPQTSDEMNMVLNVLLGLVSLGAVGTVGYKIKKRNI